MRVEVIDIVRVAPVSSLNFKVGYRTLTLVILTAIIIVFKLFINCQPRTFLFGIVDILFHSWNIV